MKEVVERFGNAYSVYETLELLKPIVIRCREKMSFLAYNILQLIRRLYLLGEDIRRPIERIIIRLVKAGTPITWQAGR